MAGTGTEGSASTHLEVLSFNHRQPVRFCITNPPEHNDAWVGLYPANAGDQDHGDRWHYLRDIDVNNNSTASDPARPRTGRLESPSLLGRPLHLGSSCGL